MSADDSILIARLLPPLTSLNQSESDFIASLFESVWLKKGEFFIKTGDSVTKVAFVVEGILCRYSYDQKGQKIIDQFLFDNHFFTDRKGFFSRQHSFTTIQTLTPCHLWTIPINEIETLRNTNLKFTLIIDSIIQKTMDHQMDLKNMLLVNDQLQRIRHFNDLHAHWLPFIPKRDIQRYLNISHTYYYQIQKK